MFEILSDVCEKNVFKLCQQIVLQEITTFKKNNIFFNFFWSAAVPRLKLQS